MKVNPSELAVSGVAGAGGVPDALAYTAGDGKAAADNEEEEFAAFTPGPEPLWCPNESGACDEGRAETEEKEKGEEEEEVDGDIEVDANEA